LNPKLQQVIQSIKRLRL